MPMPETLNDLEQLRSGILSQILQLGDLSGSITHQRALWKAKLSLPQTRPARPWGLNIRLTLKGEGQDGERGSVECGVIEGAARGGAFHRFRQLCQELLQVNERSVALARGTEPYAGGNDDRQPAKKPPAK